jgi:hypothetical protein
MGDRNTYLISMVTDIAITCTNLGGGNDSELKEF